MIIILFLRTIFIERNVVQICRLDVMLAIYLLV